MPAASYDAMGNMTCRNVDTSPTSTQSCDASQTGATMSYDNEGRLTSWQAPAGSTDSDQFLYDNSGNRVLQRASSSGAVSDTITFSGYTDVTISHGSTPGTPGTSTTKYYTVGGQKVAMRKDGTLSYLLTDLLGSASVALRADGSVQAVSLYFPYGGSLYTDGVMPTPYNFTGQRLDSVTGLLYYNACWYDPVSGRFISADTVDENGSGNDPYAYVKGNPETATDPSGHRMLGADGSSANIESYGGQTHLFVQDPSGVFTTTSSASNYTSWACTYNCYRPSYYNYSGYANYYGKHLSYRPPSHPAHHSIANKARPVAKTIENAAINVGKAALGLADTVFGVSRSIGDVQKLAGNGSAGEKAAAALDLGFNIITDVTMFTGEGEELRAADLAAEGGLDAATQLGEDGGATALEDLAAGCGLSFTYTTVVATAVGAQAIGSLKPGEQVWAYNQQAKKMELEVVRHLWITQDNDLVDLTLTHKIAASKGKVSQQSSEMIHTNKKHPFLTVEKGFVPVGQLKLGMHVVESGGRVGVVSGWLSVLGTQVMYNLEVTQDHTYTVGTGQWVVHNEGRCTVGDLDPLHSPSTSGRRPELENLSDQELLDAANNPKNGVSLRLVQKQERL